MPATILSAADTLPTLSPSIVEICAFTKCQPQSCTASSKPMKMTWNRKNLHQLWEAYRQPPSLWCSFLSVKIIGTRGPVFCTSYYVLYVAIAKCICWRNARHRILSMFISSSEECPWWRIAACKRHMWWHTADNFIYKSLFTENSVATQKHWAKHKYKQDTIQNTTIKSITVVDTWYWSINKISYIIIFTIRYEMLF